MKGIIGLLLVFLCTGTVFSQTNPNWNFQGMGYGTVTSVINTTTTLFSTDGVNSAVFGFDGTNESDGLISYRLSGKFFWKTSKSAPVGVLVDGRLDQLTNAQSATITLGVLFADSTGWSRSFSIDQSQNGWNTYVLGIPDSIKNAVGKISEISIMISTVSDQLGAVGVRMDVDRLRFQWDYSGNVSLEDSFGDNITSVADMPVIPEKFTLYQNYPNPFNPTTVVRYYIPQSGPVSLKVYDILGKEVANLVTGNQLFGMHEVSFNGNNLASGTYVCRLTAGGKIQIIKMLLLK